MSAARSVPAEAPPVAVPAAVEVDRVSKDFRIPRNQPHTLKERVLHPGAARDFERLAALRDVSLSVTNGEFFGIVGRNGSGKSTLLKVMAGIYEPTSGTVTTRGRVATFIELGVGFNPELTAWDNVLINGTMLGLSRKDAASRFERVIEFAELEEFVDLKLKNYSSGMTVRLAFSTAVQVDADILLVDEVLAVGDVAFQEKCFAQFHQMKADGRTILFVTHDMGAVERFCDRAMLLERGRMVEVGDPVDIGRLYTELNFGRQVEVHVGETRAGSRNEGEIVAIWFEQPRGSRVDIVSSGATATVAFEVWTRERIEDLQVSVMFRNADRQAVFAPSSEFDADFRVDLGADGRYVVRLDFECLLGAGRYDVTPTIARRGGLENVIDLRDRFGTIVVGADRPSIGSVELPHRFSVEPA